MDAFQEQCGQRFGEGAALSPANLIDSGKFEVKTEQATISVAGRSPRALRSLTVSTAAEKTVLSMFLLRLRGGADPGRHPRGHRRRLSAHGPRHP